MSDAPLTPIVGYLDTSRKANGLLHIITMQGQRIAVPAAIVASKHKIEPGEDGAYRFFLHADAMVSAEIQAKDLYRGQTHWSSDTARPVRHGMRAASVPDDGSTHWASDTA
jgi:hypothetical protein